MSSEAYHWALTDIAPELEFGRGQAPRMTWSAWSTSQGVELGATAPDAWYRRCPRSECQVWAGPYAGSLRAEDDGMEHGRLAHPPDTHRGR